MKVRFLNKDRESKTITCNEGEKLLLAGLRSGISLPYECGTGTCGTCVARAKPGTIIPNDTELIGNKNLKKERGDFLLCQCVPSKDCDILVDSKSLIKDYDYPLPNYFQGKLQNIKLTAPDVVTADLKLDSKVKFIAGQFFLLKSSNVVGYRAYSMTNYDENTDELKFVIKKTDQGKFTNHIFNNLEQKFNLEAFGPLGKATFYPDEKKDLIFVAGGSGIAGLMSILEHGDQQEYFKRYNADIFFGVQTVEDFFFTEELFLLKKKYPGKINLYLATSNENTDKSLTKNSEQKIDQGYIHTVLEKNMNVDCSDKIAFLGGPSIMVNSALPIIIKSGVKAENIRFDRYG